MGRAITLVKTPVTEPLMLPAGPGAYLLAIRLRRSVTLPIASLHAPQLAAGIYLYCGSAYGPGGIRARVTRHLRQCKVRHWHIDYLSAVAPVRWVLTVPGRAECDLGEAVQALLRTRSPIPRFGSTDCRRCASHLLALDSRLTVAMLANVRAALLAA